jgi:tRNA modification GTPase
VGIRAADTIAAIATAQGAAALSVVRVSGPGAVAVADDCFRGLGRLSDADGYTAHFGRIEHRGDEVDQVVATVFRSPHSYTGEDAVELSCHGGGIAARLVLEALLAGGARMARPGEFTERAFVNGKMDLVQAEAVADLIHATSEAAQRVAVRQLEGRYSELLGRLRDELLDVTGYVELELDFSEEDVAFADRTRLSALLEDAGGTLDRLVDSGRAGRMTRDGVRVVIAGRPNAGKSSLMNALVGHDRAIVSEEAGTTRDSIEADLDLDGFLFRIVDTAGLRAEADGVEAEGIRRTGYEMRRADVILYVFDASVGLADGEVSAVGTEHPDTPVVLVANKRDLVESGIQPGAVPVSATAAMHDERELDPLLDALRGSLDPVLRAVDASPALANARHREHLRRASEAVGRAHRALGEGRTGDLVAQDLRLALHELGCITGAVTSEDVLERIFSRFCIGK